MNDDLLQEMFRSRDAALLIALQTMDKRLAGMNEFRATISDQSNKMATRVEMLSTLETSDAKHGAAIENLRERINTEGKPNYVIAGSFATVVISAVAALWLILGLRIDTSISPMNLEIAAIHGRQIAEDSQLVVLSEQFQRLRTQTESDTSAVAINHNDNNQMVERVHDLEGNAIAAKAALAEVETQFCSADTIRNLMHANDLRIFSLLWHKAFVGSELPTDNAYYPIVCHGGSNITTEVKR